MQKPLLTLVLIFIFAASARSQQPCVALLQHGLYDTFVERGYSQQSSVLFNSLCTSYREQKKGDGFLGINIGGLGIKLGGDSLKEIGRMMCDEGYKEEDAVAKQVIYKQVLNQTALDVFNNCIQNTKDGLQVETTRPSDDTVVISLRYVSPNSAKLAPQGVILTNQNFDCIGSLSELAKKGGRLKSTTTKQVTCTRSNLFDPPNVVAGRHLYHEGGTFTIDTNAGTVVRYLGPKPAVPEMFQARLEAVEEGVKALDVRLGKQRGVESFSCRLTDYLNNWDGALNSHCKADESLHGLYSIHDNDKEDRRWKFYCCKLRLKPEG